MSMYIETFLQRNKQEPDPSLVPPHLAPGLGQGVSNTANSHGLSHMWQLDQAMNQMQLSPGAAASSFPPRGSAASGGDVIEDFRRRNVLPGSWVDGGQISGMTSMPGTNAQVLLALRQKEQKEMEKQKLNKFFMNMKTQDENKIQVVKISNPSCSRAKPINLLSFLDIPSNTKQI